MRQGIIIKGTVDEYSSDLMDGAAHAQWYPLTLH